MMPMDEMEYLELVKEQAEIKGQITVHSNALRSGAESFKELRMSVQELEGKPLKPIQLLGVIAGPILGIASIVWAASRYPDRSEFERLGDKVRTMEVIQIESGRDVKDINNKLGDIQKKLEKLLDKGNP